MRKTTQPDSTSAAATPAAATRARPPSLATRPLGADATASGDPDVALLSAMLARLSGDRSRAEVAEAQATIAQLVERCEARVTQDSIESFECRRRICAGYWGKADACPMALAPKAR